MVNQDPRLVPHPDAVLRRVGSGAVLVHLGSGHVFELNATASRAWELAADGLRKSVIIESLMAEYAGSRESITSDVDELFQLLASKGLVST
jgi:hypothetical protein